MSAEAPRASWIQRTRVSWLWPAYVPRGKLTVLDGDPGLGKSTVALDLAARLSTASPLPDGARPDCPVASIIMSAEDAPEDTIRPRLDAAGADLDRIIIFRAVDERPPELPGDLNVLEGLIDEEDAALVVVDPLLAYLSGRFDAHRDQDVRRALYKIAQVAERTGAAVVIVRHLNKGFAGGNPLYRGGGSIGIVGAARAGMLVAPDPEDEGRRVLAMTKSNLAAMPPALAYRLVQADEFDCARVAWDGKTEYNAADLLRGPSEPTPRDEAADALTEALRDGPRPMKEVVTEVQEATGASEKTIRRASKQLGIESFRRSEKGTMGGGTWCWSLEGTKMTTNQDGHPLEHTSGHLDLGRSEGLSGAPGNQDGHESDAHPLGDWSFAEAAPCIVCGKPCTARDPEVRVRHPACPIEVAS